MEEEHFDDARIEAMLGKLRLQDPTGFRCESGNMIRRMCVNPICNKNSLICGDEDCLACYKDAHDNCKEVRLKNVTNLLNSRLDCQKEIIIKVCDIETKFVN